MPHYKNLLYNYITTITKICLIREAMILLPIIFSFSSFFFQPNHLTVKSVFLLRSCVSIFLPSTAASLHCTSPRTNKQPKLEAQSSHTW